MVTLKPILFLRFHLNKSIKGHFLSQLELIWSQHAPTDVPCVLFLFLPLLNLDQSFKEDAQILIQYLQETVKESC